MKKIKEYAYLSDLFLLGTKVKLNIYLIFIFEQIFWMVERGSSIKQQQMYLMLCLDKNMLK